ncbi:hypothetical protein EZV62_009320 [Acer yangbiense]|uniref:Uncharacterized protein n=1 Tax=Acer yangbiense TaxID=1000413 RepID=A0A5C7IG82_9ROSI|nr:hypothetical protein EZV62_009320 [Acer yangbiense]
MISLPTSGLVPFAFKTIHSLYELQALACRITLPMLALFLDHLVEAYQYLHLGERWLTKEFPTSRFVNNFYTFRIIPPLLPPLKINLSRLCFRTAYVTLILITSFNTHS